MLELTLDRGTAMSDLCQEHCIDPHHRPEIENADDHLCACSANETHAVMT